MKHYPKAITALITLAAVSSADAASVVVDWLLIQNGGTAAAFTLVNDATSATATGSVSIAKGSPGPPTARTFSSASWSIQPDLTDTVTGDTSISVTDFRVVPAGGQASYVINLRVPSNQPLIVVVGGMLKNSISATQYVEIAALSDSETAPVTLRSTNAWSNGLTNLNQGVSWNPLTQLLSTTVGANGDSEFAFFEVGPIAGTNPRVSFAIPFGYASGTGDSISIGLGTVIPEPTTAGMLLLGAGAFAGRRNRSRNQPPAA